jgi:hypothetical protein
MARDDEPNLAPYYIGVGVLAAAAAGYLLWKYVFQDEQTRARAAKALSGAASRAATMGKKAASSAMDMAGQAAGGAKEMVKERFG